MFSRRMALALVVLFATPLLTGLARGVPAPAPAPRTWQLEFQFEDPQRITLQLPGESKARTYWYVLYGVTNNTGRDVQLLPRFTIVTDQLRTIRADGVIDPAVFAAIKKIHAGDWPFLLEPLQAMGRLLQGRDNTKDSVAIWPDFTDDVRRFTVFVGGLSGDTAEMVNATYDPSKPETTTRELPGGIVEKVVVNPRRFVLYKTLAVSYRLPGDPEARLEARPIRERVEWVMR